MSAFACYPACKDVNTRVLAFVRECDTRIRRSGGRCRGKAQQAGEERDDDEGEERRTKKEEKQTWGPREELAVLTRPLSARSLFLTVKNSARFVLDSAAGTQTTFSPGVQFHIPHNYRRA